MTKPNKALQLTAGSRGFYSCFWDATGFGWSDAFQQIPTATELRLLGCASL